MADRTVSLVPNPAVDVDAITPDADVATLIGAFIASFENVKTRDAYRLDLKHWLGWCATMNVEPLTIRRTHIDLYLHAVRDQGYADSTRARRLSTISSFFNWLVDEDLAPANPAARVKPIKVNRPDMPSLNKHEMHRLLAHVETDRRIKPYERALILTLALCALRISEVCNADVEDLVVEQWTPTLKVTAKGNVPHVTFVPPRAMAAIDTALDGRTSGPLMLNRAGNRMTRANAANLVKRIAGEAGFGDRGITPHAFRRSAIEIALSAGAQIRDVQNWVNHQSINSTTYYDRRHLTPERSPGYQVQSAVA